MGIYCYKIIGFCNNKMILYLIQRTNARVMVGKADHPSFYLGVGRGVQLHYIFLSVNGVYNTSLDTIDGRRQSISSGRLNLPELVFQSLIIL